MVMVERRKVKRKRLVNYPAVFNKDSYLMIGRMINASTAGAMISCEEPVKENTNFMLKLTLPKAVDGKNDITVESKSIWCLEDDETGYYNTGFQLLNLSSTNQAIINQMIQNNGYDY